LIRIVGVGISRVSMPNLSRGLLGYISRSGRGAKKEYKKSTSKSAKKQIIKIFKAVTKGRESEKAEQPVS